MTTYSLGFDIWAKDRASKEFDKLSGSVSKTDEKFGKLNRGVAKGAAVAGAALVGFATSGVDNAANLELAIRRTDIVFGENAKTVQSWATSSAENLGLSNEAALVAAGGFGNMFQQMGFATGESAKMSTSTVQLVADLAAFNGLPTEQVLEGMSAAFRGEYDALQRVLPGISANRIETEALAMTGKKSADALTDQEKAVAILAIAQNDGAAASGYFAANQGQLAIKSQVAQASAADLAATFGAALVPAINSVVGVLAPMLGFLAKHPAIAYAIAGAVAVLSVGLLALSVASKIATIAQAGLNLAWLAFPGTWIIAALVAVGVALYLLWTRSETFRRIVMAVWNEVRVSALNFYNNGVLPVWRGVQTAFTAMANVVIGFYNRGVAPMARLVIDAFVRIMRTFADMLGALAKVPGFGWADTAAGKIRGAADAASNLRDRIVNIPSFKTVEVSINQRFKTFGNPFKGVGAIAMAGGGRTEPGQLTLVGEQGPELWIPDRRGTVVPADETSRMLARSGARGLGGSSREDLAELGRTIVDGFRKTQREHARELLLLLRARGAGGVA